MRCIVLLKGTQLTEAPPSSCRPSWSWEVKQPSPAR